MPTDLEAQKSVPLMKAGAKKHIQHSAKYKARPDSVDLASSSGEEGPLSPCVGVPGITYFEVDDVFSVTSRGLVHQDQSSVQL
jgi:hypothetical protein